ncbi:MAG: DUF2071 domain-containing protein [Bacteroidota bacterium]
MRIPIVAGTIDRRILINYRVELSVLRKMLPSPFRPTVVDGYGIAGIDLIRFKNLRVKGLPNYLGYTSENAVHRISVEWEELGHTRRGLYTPRLDTDSFTTSMIGGRVFPGLHHRSRFKADESDSHFNIKMKCGSERMIELEASLRDRFPMESVFRTLGRASRFFAGDQIAYSPRFQKSIFDGVELRCRRWKLEPLQVDFLDSHYFAQRHLFPKGSIYFDHACIMRDIEHEWHARGELIASRPIRLGGMLL